MYKFIIILIIIGSLSARRYIRKHVIREPVHIQGVRLDRNGGINEWYRQEAIADLFEIFREDDIEPEHHIDYVTRFFEQADFNNDGLLDRDEIVYRMEQVWEDHDRIYTNSVVMNMDDADKNNDGHVSWDEYLVEYKFFEGFDGTGLREEKIEFDSWDFNKNGFLEFSEFKCFLFPELDRQAMMIIAERIANKLDNNTDLVLSQHEFVHGTGYLKVEQQQRREALFKRIDFLRAGQIAVIDLFDFMNPGNVYHNRREAEHMLLFDMNGDEKLSLKELLENNWYPLGVPLPKRAHSEL